MNRIPVVSNEQSADYGAPTTDVNAGQEPATVVGVIEEAGREVGAIVMGDAAIVVDGVEGAARAVVAEVEGIAGRAVAEVEKLESGAAAGLSGLVHRMTHIGDWLREPAAVPAVVIDQAPAVQVETKVQ